MNNFEEEIKYIERELQGLKTAQRYTSTKNVAIATFSDLQTGLYLVTFEKEDFMADYFTGYLDPAKSAWASAYPRTPNDDQQVIEIDTTTPGDDPDGARVDNSTDLAIVSSVPVKDFSRLS